MDKSPEAFRTISEVSESLETPAHVLRFWETRFPQIRPIKRAGGRRYYRPADVALLAGIKRLLHEDGLTIRGVQKVLREQGVRHVSGISEDDLTAEDGAVNHASFGANVSGRPGLRHKTPRPTILSFPSFPALPLPLPLPEGAMNTARATQDPTLSKEPTARRKISATDSPELPFELPSDPFETSGTDLDVALKPPLEETAAGGADQVTEENTVSLPASMVRDPSLSDAIRTMIGESLSDSLIESPHPPFGTSESDPVPPSAAEKTDDEDKKVQLAEYPLLPPTDSQSARKFEASPERAPLEEAALTPCADAPEIAIFAAEPEAKYTGDLSMDIDDIRRSGTDAPLPSATLAARLRALPRGALRADQAELAAISSLLGELRQRLTLGQ